MGFQIFLLSESPPNASMIVSQPSRMIKDLQYSVDLKEEIPDAATSVREMKIFCSSTLSKLQRLGFPGHAPKIVMHTSLNFLGTIKSF